MLRSGWGDFSHEMDKHWNRNYLLANDILNCDNFTNDAAQANFFVGNTRRKVAAAGRTVAAAGPKLEQNGVATPRELRRWLAAVSGRSLNDIGIQPCEAFPQGQAGIDHEVSPNYYR